MGGSQKKRDILQSLFKLILIIVACSLPLAIASAGCGDNEPADTYTPEASTTMTVAEPSLTKAQFVRQVNKICRTAWVTVLDNWEVYTGAQEGGLSEQELFPEAVRLSLLAGLDFHIFDDIRQLGSPQGEEEETEAIIRPFQVAVELGWKERWEASSSADVVSQFDIFNERARAYGLDDCLITEARLRPIEPS